MEFYNQISTNYLSGKQVYPELRRIISFLLKFSITCNIYFYFFGMPSYSNMTTFPLIIEYLLSGRFIVFLSIFSIVHFTIYIVGNLLFFTLTFYPIIKWQKKIINYEVRESARIVGQGLLEGAVRYQLADNAKEEEVYFAYLLAVEKLSLKSNQIKLLKIELDKKKIGVEQNFHFSLLIIIASIFYFSFLPDFNCFLFVFNVIIGLGMAIFSMYSYRLIEVFPTLLLKLKEILKKEEVEEIN